MAPHLPPELLQEILALALADSSAHERQQTRLGFGAVSKAWRASVDDWKQVEIVDYKQLAKLTAKMESLSCADSLGDGCEDVGRRIDQVYLELVGDPGAAAVTQTQASFTRFLSLAPNITSLALIIGRRSLVDSDLLNQYPSDDYDGSEDEDLLGPIIGPALCKLEHVRHFLLGDDCDSDEPWLSTLWLKRILADWSALRTFSLNDCYIGAPMNDLAPWSSIWSSHPSLHAVRLQTFNVYFAVRQCLGRLPPSVTILSIDDDSLYSQAFWAEQVIECVTEYASQITELSILGSPQFGPPLHVSRGRWGALLRRMTNLRKLGISICAVDNLSAVLAKHPHLADLTVVQTHLHSDAPLSVHEVITFLRSSAAIRRLRLGSEIWTRWSGLEVRAVKRVAEEKGITVGLLPTPDGDEWSDAEWEDVATDEESDRDGGSSDDDQI